MTSRIFSRFLALGIVLSAPLMGQDVVNGDFSNQSSIVKGSTGSLLIDDLDAGWAGNTNHGRAMNAQSSANIGSSIAALSTSGNTGGFLLVDTNVASTSDATLWNLFSFGSNLSTLSLDVAVLTNPVRNDGTPIDLSAEVSVANAGNIQYRVYGFNGDAAALTSALTAENIRTGGNFLNTPAPSFTLVGGGSLSAVAALDTWETQSLTLSDNPGTYDYALLGFFVSGNGGLGVGIDNVTVIPEPATVAFLSMAVALLYIVRRRRA